MPGKRDVRTGGERQRLGTAITEHLEVTGRKSAAGHVRENSSCCLGEVTEQNTSACKSKPSNGSLLERLEGGQPLLPAPLPWSAPGYWRAGTRARS